MLKCVFLDWNGVLLDDFNRVYDAIVYVAKHFASDANLQITKQDLKQAWTVPQFKVFHTWGIDKTHEELSPLFKIRYASSGISSPLFHTVLPFLEWLRNWNMVKVFIVSTQYEDLLEIELKKHNIRQYFDGLTGGSDRSSITKEDAIARILQNEKIQPNEALFVGDTTFDIESGRQIGVITVGILTGYHSEERLSDAQPDYLVESLVELRDIIEALTGK